MTVIRWIRRRKCLALLGLTGLLLVAAVIFHQPLLMSVGGYLSVSQPPTNADAIRVMGGHPERYRYAVDLFERGYGSRLILSLQERWDPLLQRTNVEIVRDFAEAEGVPKQTITVTSTASTYEEAVFTAQRINEAGLESVLVVSSPFHMRRVATTFRQVIGDRAELTFVAVPFERSTYQRAWWRDEDSISSVVHEYVSLVYYAFNYFW